MNKKRAVIAIIILIIDQITKLICELYKVNMVVIKNIFSLTYVQNTGAAWSILENKLFFLIIISLIMLVFVYNLSFSFEENKLSNLSFGLLFGGIIGNLIDRVFYSYVRDFISVNIFGYEFPIFNIADMAIVIGVVILLYETIKGEIKRGNRSKRKCREN